jgi:hypothetical protein
MKIIQLKFLQKQQQNLQKFIIFTTSQYLFAIIFQQQKHTKPIRNYQKRRKRHLQNKYHFTINNSPISYTATKIQYHNPNTRKRQTSITRTVIYRIKRERPDRSEYKRKCIRNQREQHYFIWCHKRRKRKKGND